MQFGTRRRAEAPVPVAVDEDRAGEAERRHGALPQGQRAGAASQRAIGTVVFGGMLSSTFLAIPFVPVFYVFVESAREKLGRKKKAKADPSED